LLTKKRSYRLQTRAMSPQEWRGLSKNSDASISNLQLVALVKKDYLRVRWLL